MTATAAIVHHDNPCPTANPGRPRPVVLVAEESDVERCYLADNLAADGYTIRIADCREKALASLVAVPPVDIAVIDVNGQTLDLIDAVARRRRTRRSRRPEGADPGPHQPRRGATPYPAA